MQLLSRIQAENFEFPYGKVIQLICRNIEENSALALNTRYFLAIKIIVKSYVLAGGAINSPAVLLRSAAPDSQRRLWKRAFLHPVVISSFEFFYTCRARGRAALMPLPVKRLRVKIENAHVMGGCGLVRTEKQCVSRPDGLHLQLDKLSVHDGSLLPTRMGAKPQLSVYGRVNRLEQGLWKRLAGRNMTLTESAA